MENKNIQNNEFMISYIENLLQFIRGNKGVEDVELATWISENAKPELGVALLSVGKSARKIMLNPTIMDYRKSMQELLGNLGIRDEFSAWAIRYLIDSGAPENYVENTKSIPIIETPERIVDSPPIIQSGDPIMESALIMAGKAVPPAVHPSIAVSKREVSILEPTFSIQKNKYLLYFEEKHLFRGYIKPDGSVTIGQNPFAESELAQAYGFNSMEMAVQWAESHNLIVIGKENLASKGWKRTKFIVGSVIIIVVGFLGTAYGIVGTIGVPDQWIYTLPFAGIGIFLLYNGIRRFLKK